jgi:hypothetical protein
MERREIKETICFPYLAPSKRSLCGLAVSGEYHNSTAPIVYVTDGLLLQGTLCRIEKVKLKK